MPKWAEDNAEGQHAYVVTTRSIWDWDRKPWHQIEYAGSLAEAKREHGFTRDRHSTVSVRRATPEDVAAIGDGARL